MNTLVVVVMLAPLLLVHAAGGKNCFNRREKREMQKLRMMNSCEHPTLQLVDIPVPPGYTSVNPSMAMVKRCGALMCMGSNTKCVASNTTSKLVKVMAMTQDMMSACAHVPVDEHQSCGCVCDMAKMNCSLPMVADGTMCMCKCSDTDREACPNDGSHFWSFEKCSCTRY
ncbi:uncharacterized protein [Procambarus clarkii]|uniref:uncharacterized protein n=1 Tax=Procambarus clarkii TaxID=6728 RepID=UPI001E678E00|nr:uncharacterized protein LOC123757479 [Procambarus clarkii]